MKKEYILPNIKIVSADIAEILASTTLDSNQGDQTVTPSDEEYNGGFGAKSYVWDE